MNNRDIFLALAVGTHAQRTTLYEKRTCSGGTGNMSTTASITTRNPVGDKEKKTHTG